MNEIETKWANAEGEELFMFPQRVEGMLTGVACIERVDSTAVTLWYEDGSQETGELQPALASSLLSDARSVVLCIVSHVQSQRPKTHETERPMPGVVQDCLRFRAAIGT